MQRLVLAIAALALALALTGCATLSKVECQAGDWQGIGLSDGSRGLSSARFEQHVEACSEHGVTPNRDLYMLGYDAGNKAFCRLDKAVDLGTAGTAYYQVCTGDVGLSFGRVYLAARDVYLARNAANEIRGEIDDVTRRLSEPGATDEARSLLGEQMLSLQRSLDRQLDTISREERDLRDVMAAEVRRLNMLGLEA